ncbi:MAG: hypothetical protein SOY31_02140 [Bacilli bacterium]|nr:hypothetical protein [Bacilli bacterium]
MDKQGRTRVIALLSSLCGASFIALMCSIFAWFIPNNQLDNTHISGSLLRGYFHEASFQTNEGIKFSDGSKAYPYVITRPQHLYNLAHLQFEYVDVGVNKISFADMGYHFQIGWNLNDDADLEVYSITGEVSDKKVLDMNGMTLPPIGFIDQTYKENTAPTASNGNYSFKGTFEGNGFNICNFTIEGSFSSGGKKYYPKNIGFFGDIAKHTCKSTEVEETDQVSNFTLSDVTINTYKGKENAAQDEKVNYVGYACGYIDEGKLSKVGVYNCRINCTSSYFRSNYTLIGEKNVSNSSLAENAPILDYAFDPNKFTTEKIWHESTENYYKNKSSETSYSTFVFSTSSSTVCSNGESMNDHIFYKDSQGNYNSYSSIRDDSKMSSYISNMLYDPRVFDVRGEIKSYKVKPADNFDSETNTKILTEEKLKSKMSSSLPITIDSADFTVNGDTGYKGPTDYNGNKIKIVINKASEATVNTLNVGNSTDSNVKKFEYTCNGSGKFFFMFSPNKQTTDNLCIYKKNSNNTYDKFISISVTVDKSNTIYGYEIPIILNEGETSATFRMGFENEMYFRVVYLRFMMQSEFGNTGGSGSVDLVDYTYSTLEIPESTGFTLSRITIRFDSPDSKDVIIVVTREKSDTSDEIKISSESKYFIGTTKTNFTIINKAPAGSITINYPPSG